MSPTKFLDLEDPTERGAWEHYSDATYYDHAYRDRDEDIAFYRGVARRSAGPVLELGVGTGRVATAIALDGIEVVGIDRHPVMLAQARARARAAGLPRSRLSLRRGDLKSFSLGRRFAVIIAPFNTLLHLYEPREFQQCFERVRAHLAPGGRFVFDVRVPQPEELARDPERAFRAKSFVHPTLGKRVKYTEYFRYEPLKQVQYVTIKFEPVDGSPAVETLLSQRQVFPAELRALLALGGLRIARRMGSFDGRPLGPDDVDQIIEAVAITARSR